MGHDFPLASLQGRSESGRNRNSGSVPSVRFSPLVQRCAFLVRVAIFFGQISHAMAVPALRRQITSTILDDRRIIRICDGLKAFCPTDRAWFLVLQPFPFPLEFHDDRAELSLCACIKTTEILPFKQGPDQSFGPIVETIGLQLLKVFSPVHCK